MSEMRKPVKPSTILTRAAKWIDEHGLAKGEYWKYRNGKPLIAELQARAEKVEIAKAKGCKACTWGGLYIGAYDPGVDSDVAEDAASKAARYVHDVTGNTTRSIPIWNDDPARTKEEVVQTLKEAAKAARKDGK